MRKISEFLSENVFFYFLVVKFSVYLNRRVFVMRSLVTLSLDVTGWLCSVIVSIPGHLLDNFTSMEHFRS